MTDSDRRAEDERRLDRTLFRLDDKDFDAFKALLDDPMTASAALRKLLTTPSPWET